MKPMRAGEPMTAEVREDLPTPLKSLRQLAEAEESCKRCPLYRDATQAVPGEGPSHAPFMLVGEQPGDKEDLAGKPFVGPPAASSIRRCRTPASNEPKLSSPTP
jgi:DNA polymerase